VESGDLKIEGVYETVLYARDPRGTGRFYSEILGLRPVLDPDELSAAFRLPDGGMLLVFDPSRSSQEGRPVPSHGAEGAGHAAFRLGPGALEDARASLVDRGIEIEREVDWGRGRSLYFRDPAGNSVELVEGDIWPPLRDGGD
jgi:catechol 2,3-dioxygenase-like lactoylglutathione lyase family enzyme